MAEPKQASLVKPALERTCLRETAWHDLDQWLWFEDLWIRNPQCYFANCWDGAGLMEGKTGLWRSEIDSLKKSKSANGTGCYQFVQTLRGLTMWPNILVLTWSLGPSQTSSASAAILMALISVKCTPKQNAALVGLKHKIGLLKYFIIDSSFLFSLSCL